LVFTNTTDEITIIKQLMTDQQIIATIKDYSIKNCEAALNCVYGRYYNMIESFITQNNGTKDDAKDIFQETMISLYNNVKNDKYSPDSKLSTYLFTISKNIWYKKLRKKGKMSNLEDNQHKQIASGEDIHGQLEYTEQQKLIGKLLHKVGQECGKILKLFYFEKMRMVKIADKMDYSSEQVAKNQKSKCMKKLRIVVMSNDNIQEQLRNSY